MQLNEEHLCPQCGKGMMQRTVTKLNCSASAEFILTPCPGNEPTTNTPLEGTPSEEFNIYYCPQCNLDY